jgi:hypothetical protein
VFPPPAGTNAAPAPPVSSDTQAGRQDADTACMRRPTRRCRRARVVGLRLAGATLVLAACSAPGHAASRRVVRITLRDFAIDAPTRVPPGRVTVEVHNEGPVDHEMLLVRAPGGRIPVRADGVTADESALESRIVASVEPEGPGSVHVLHVTLRPGHYVVLCNMAGHYLSGMHALIDVV